ncbi:MAG TPA: hypothetical protein VMA13_10345 [Candidatus Saccharimonadales bacterium]|nr:hypothetical protein [Candidatus Saccharimonadales bacterium]
MRNENPCFQRRTGVNNRPIPADNLRLELNPKSFVLLPYHHLEMVKFEAGDGQDTLTLLFLNRTVCITGKSLRVLALGLQDCCVEFIKPLPERYAPLIGDEVSVKAIEIEDQKERG